MTGPLAAELWQVDQALAGVRSQLASLEARRTQLLGLLRAERAAQLVRTGAPVPSPAVSAGAATEVSRWVVQNVLLVLGGLLLTVAAIVFTVVSWGHLGIGGRAAILGGITAVALAVPALLLRRNLTATAETVAVLGLALIALDGYAAQRVGLFGGVAGDLYAAGVIAVVALAAAGQGRVLPLRVPPPVAIVLAQVPLPLAFNDTALQIMAAFTGTVALDVAVWVWVKRRELRITATCCLALSSAAALFVGVVDSVVGDTVLAMSGLLGVLAGLGVFVALRVPNAARVVPVGVAVVALTFAVGSPVRPALPYVWQDLPYPIAALVVGVGGLLLAERLRNAWMASGAGVAFLGALPYAGPVVIAVYGPFTNLAGVWDRAPWVPVGLAALRPGSVVLMVFAVVCGVFAGLARPYRRWGLAGVLGFGSLALVVGPSAFGLGYGGVVAVIVLLAVLLSVAATRHTDAAWAAGAVAVVGVAWALAFPWATYATLAVFLVTWGVLYRRPAALAGAALSGGGLVWAVLGGFGLRVLDSCSVGLAVAGALALIGAYGLRLRTPVGASRAGGSAAWGAGSFGRVLSAWLAGAAVLPVVDVVARALTAVEPAFQPWRGARVLAVQRPLVLVALGVAALVLVALPRVAVLVGALGLLVAVVPAAIGLPYPVILVLLVVGAAAAAGVASSRPSTDQTPSGQAPVGQSPVGEAPVGESPVGEGLVGEGVDGRGAVVPGPMGSGAEVRGQERRGPIGVGLDGPGVRMVAGVVGGWLGVLAVGAGLSERWATLAVLPALALIAGATSAFGRGRALGVTLAAMLAAGEVAAVAQASGLRAASLVSATAGVIAVAAGAWKKQRRIGYLGIGFLLVASWVRLWAEHVEVIEAYTVPFSVALLGIGWWRTRGEEVSSWRAYGTGLLFSFGPSLLAEPTSWRSVLLGAVALGVTVAGARARLQAPVVLGGLTLAVVAVRELAPPIAELVSAMPRWIPIAVGGLLLLVIGATYESRKRDMLRLRNAVTKLR
ncbi:SCO7613 C-terminal domain-containing membrane protein [Nonomuraea sp. NPDC050536]|uniref:SCO7613 C-terminal domain-containing membrane protein n=1 Tax=Nonomuraea sp. NPDC050536 TaxID=3364366 RepID=UPI0037CB2488